MKEGVPLFQLSERDRAPLRLHACTKVNEAGTRALSEEERTT
jgi:hypothetical protein